MQDNGLKVNQVTPIVTCRITELNGRPAEELQRDTTDKVSNWAIRREYRVTYRDSLHHSEKLLEGTIHRSEEHTSELQSRENLVCRLLLEKKKKKREIYII